MSRRTVRKVLFLIMIFAAVATAGYALQFIGGPRVPSAHGYPGQTGQNLLGISCALGTIDPVTGTTFTGRDGNWSTSGVSSIEKSCQWAGDTDGDGPTPLAGNEPLVSDPAPLLPAATCPASPGIVAPCGAPGGGGFEADIILTNVNSGATDGASINGFDLTISYDPTVLHAIQIDQAGLLFGGNVGCSSCTLALASTIDNTVGQVRVAQAVLGTVTGTQFGTVPLFRIRFDVVAAGTTALTIGGADKITYSLANVATPLAHTDVQSSFSTNVFFDNLVNGLAYPSSLNFNASFTSSPASPTAGGMITFTGFAACGACTGALSYHWNFSTAEGITPIFSQTGQIVNINDTLFKVNRITLEVSDSATPTPNIVTATQRVGLGVSTLNALTTVARGSSANVVGRWFGGVPPYTGSWLFCAKGTTLPAVKVCTTATTSGTTSIPSTTTEFIQTPMTWNFAGLYTGTLTISDSNPLWVGGSNTAMTNFQVNVTGTPQVFTVTATPNMTSITAPHSVNVTATVAYTSTYPAGDKASSFIYTYIWGDGATSTVSGKLSVTTPHIYTKAGSFIVQVEAQENTPSPAPTSVVENGFTSAITVAGGGPSVAISCPSTGTVGTVVSCTATGSGGTPPYTFAWTATGGSPSSGTTNPFMTNYGAKGTYQISVILTDSASNTATRSASITISPLTLSTTVTCPSSAAVGQSITCTTTTSGGTTPYKYAWSVNSVANTTATSSSFSTTFTSAGSESISATVTDANAVTATNSATVTVSAAFAASISCPTTGTVGTTVQCTASATGGTAPYSFSWTATGGTPSSGTGSSFTTTYSTKGSYTISVTGSDSASHTSTKSATVTIAALALTTLVTCPAAATVGQSITCTTTTSGGTTPYKYAWTVNGVVNATATSSSFSTTFTVKGSDTIAVTVTDANAKTAPSSATVTVNPLTLAITINCPTTGTVGTAVNCTASATGGTSPYTFAWTATGGTPASGTGTSFSTTYSAKGSKTISVTVTDNNGKTAPGSATVTISALTLAVTVTGPSSSSTGQSVTYTASTTGGTTPYTYAWSVNGTAVSGATSSSFTTTFNTAGHEVVSVVVTDNNAKTATNSITVAVTTTVITVTITCPSTGTVGTAVNCSASATGGTAPFTFSWTATGGSPSTGTGSSFSTTYSTKGSYTISVTATDSTGKTGTNSAPITISPLALTATITGGANTINPGQPLTYNANPSGGTSPYTFSWTATGATPSTGTGSSITITYSAKGTYTLSLTVKDANGVTATVTLPVNVTPLTLAATINGPSTATVGQTVTYTAVASGGTTPYNYAWTINGVTNTTCGCPTLTTHFATKGSFTVGLTVTDANSKTASTSATVTVSPIALAVTVNGPSSAATGQSVTYTASATGGTTPFTYAWSVNGTAVSGATSSSFTTTFNTAGHEVVSVLVTDNNAKTATNSITVTVSSTAIRVTITCPSTGTVGTAVNCSASASGGTPPFTFSWTATGGNPASATGPTFSTTYSAKGSKTISVIATDSVGGTGSASATVTISPLALAASISGPTTATVGQTVAYTAVVSGGTTPYSYVWTINGVANTTCGCPFLTTHFATKGSFTVGLSITDANSMTASTSATVTVSPIALAVTVNGPSSAKTGTSVTFTSATTGGTTPYKYAWSVNGVTNTTATSSSFSTTFTTANTYTVAVTVTDANARTATNSATIMVSAVTITVSITCPTTGTVGTAVQCTASATGGTAPFTFAWTATGGTPSTGTGSSFTTTYSSKGSKTISVTATDSTGATGSNSATLTISPLALTASITGPLSGMVGTSVTFTSSVTGGTSPYSYAWTATGGSPASGSSNSLTTTYATKGSFTVTLTVTDANSKTALASAPITVTPIVLAVTVSGPSSAPQGTSVTFSAVATGGTTPYEYAWSVNSTVITTATTSSFTTSFSTAGTEIVSVTVTDTNAKTASNSVTVTVTPVSVAHSTQTTINCSPGSVVVDTATTCTARVIDKSTTPTTPTGTVAFTTNSTGTFSPSSCTLTPGPGNSNMGTCSVSYNATVTGQHMITGTYSGDSTHAVSSGSFVLNIRSTHGKALLTFTGFAVDDFDNGVGQLDVVINGQLVVDIPAGLNHLTGSGDFRPYEGQIINFGPFDITSLLVTGQNTILFRDPTTFDHFAIVGNIVIKQDGTVLLNAPRARGVYPAFSFSYTFNSPGVTPSSQTATTISSIVVGPNQFTAYSATYTSTGSFTCTFSFGDGQQRVVRSENGSCSAAHFYDSAGTFSITLTVAPSESTDL